MEGDMTFRDGTAGCNTHLWGRGWSEVRSKTKEKKPQPCYTNSQTSCHHLQLWIKIKTGDNFLILTFIPELLLSRKDKSVITTQTVITVLDVVVLHCMCTWTNCHTHAVTSLKYSEH